MKRDNYNYIRLDAQRPEFVRELLSAIAVRAGKEERKKRINDAVIQLRSDIKKLKQKHNLK